MFKKLNLFLDNKSLNIFYIFLFIQPLLDILVSFSHYNNLLKIMVFGIRVLFLIYMIYYLIFVRKNHIRYLLILFLYAIVFLFLRSSGSNTYYEGQALIKSIYFPITLLYALELFCEKKFNIRSLFIVLFTYLILVFIPDILNIGYESYIYDKIGSVGFFFSANAVGSIISIISPLLIGYFMKCKKNIHLIVFLGIYLYVILMMGTKAPIMVLSIVLLYYLILFFIVLIKNKKYYKLLFIVILFFIIILVLAKVFPLTPFYKNLVIHAKNMEVYKITDLFNFKKLDDYIFSGRLMMFERSFDIYKSSSIFNKLFGIGYIYKGVTIKTSEMDYLVTFIHQGIFGFVLIYYTYILLIIKIAKMYIKNIKANFYDIEKSSMVLSIITSILNALLVGHVLDVPSVSIFVTSIMVYSYYNLNNKKTAKI